MFKLNYLFCYLNAALETLQSIFAGRRKALFFTLTTVKRILLEMFLVICVDQSMNVCYFV